MKPGDMKAGAAAAAAAPTDPKIVERYIDRGAPARPTLPMGKDQLAELEKKHARERAASCYAARDFIVAPLYQLACGEAALPGVSISRKTVPGKVGTVCDMGKLSVLSDEDVYKVTQKFDFRELYFPQTARGFEAVMASSLLLGEADVQPKHIATYEHGGSVTAVKVVHGHSLLVFPKDVTDLLHNLEHLFFPKTDQVMTQDRVFNKCVSSGILSFDLKTFKESIDAACSRLPERQVREIVTARINDLERQGVAFGDLLMSRHGGTIFTVPRQSFTDKLIHDVRGEEQDPRVNTKDWLIDFYVDSVMRQQELMLELSRDLDWILEETKGTSIKPAEMVEWLQYINQERAKIRAQETLMEMDAAAAAGDGAPAHRYDTEGSEYIAIDIPWMPPSMPGVPLRNRMLYGREESAVALIAANIGRELFSSAASGERRSDVERIEAHLRDALLQLKIEKHNIGLVLDRSSTELVREVIGTHASGGAWSSKQRSGSLAQIYSGVSQKEGILGGMHLPKSSFNDELTADVKGCLVALIQKREKAAAGHARS